MANGPWDVRFEDVDTPTKVAGLAVAAVAAICLGWLTLADGPVERSIAGVLVVLCILSLVGGLLFVSRDRSPTTSVGSTTVHVAQKEVTADPADTPRDKISGPDGTYFYVDRPPTDWRVRTMTMEDFASEELGTNDEALVARAAGAWPKQKILALQHPNPVEVSPEPGRSTCFGRELTTALTTEIKLQFVVAPIARPQAPLFVDGTLAENFVRAIIPMSMGLARLVRMDSGRVKATGKRQWLAEFEQQLENVRVNGTWTPQLKIRNTLWVVEGDTHDFLLRLTHTESAGAGADFHLGQSETLSRLAESFVSLAVADRDDELRQIQSRADMEFATWSASHRSEILLQEFLLAAARFGGKDLSQPEVLLSALRQVEVFDQWRERGVVYLPDEDGHEDPEIEDLFDTLEPARSGDFTAFRTAFEGIVAQTYDQPPTVGATSSSVDSPHGPAVP